MRTDSHIPLPLCCRSGLKPVFGAISPHSFTNRKPALDCFGWQSGDVLQSVGSGDMQCCREVLVWPRSSFSHVFSLTTSSAQSAEEIHRWRSVLSSGPAISCSATGCSSGKRRFKHTDINLQCRSPGAALHRTWYVPSHLVYQLSPRPDRSLLCSRVSEVSTQDHGILAICQPAAPTKALQRESEHLVNT